MTDKDINEAMEILEAYKEGATIIEIYMNGKNETKRIFNKKTCTDWLPNFSEFTYKIQPQPAYRSYNNVEEFFKDFKEHGPLLKRKIKNPSNNIYSTYVSILSIRGFWLDFNKTVDYDDNCETETTIDHLYGKYEWMDGHICGVEITK